MQRPVQASLQLLLLLCPHMATAFTPMRPPPVPGRAFSRTLNAVCSALVVFEDEDYFFVRKPPHVTVAGDQERDEESFHERVKAHAIEHYGHQPNLLHRLDRGTSGLMVYAKSLENAKHFLRLQDIKGAITKDYVAVACGAPPPRPDGSPTLAGRIDGGIAKSRDKRSFVVRSRGSGKAVLTTYRVIGQAEHPRLGPLSGLSLRLFTGRKHQIRASCRKLGCAIVGDDLYKGPAHHTMLLHAQRVAFSGPRGVMYDVSCPPEWGAAFEELVMGADNTRDSAPRARGNTATDGDFLGLKVAELKELLRQRQLPVSGNKPELARRLVEHANEA
jgi:23S rRNA-/tRNA-specific pseudouridylate synthase